MKKKPKKPQEAPQFHLLIRVQPIRGDEDGTRRLRLALKAMLRQMGMKVLMMREWKPEDEVGEKP